MPRSISLISYWTAPRMEDQRTVDGVFIRHTSQAEAAYISSCQTNGKNGNMPSACVWMVPGTEG